MPAVLIPYVKPIMDGLHMLCPCFEWQVKVLVPRPHPLMSKNDLLKYMLLRQCNFISRLLMHSCTAEEGTSVSKCPVLVTVFMLQKYRKFLKIRPL